MKMLAADSRWFGLKRRLLTVAVLLGITGSHVGCGCECATVATLATAAVAAAPVVFVAREVQEARKTQLEIERLEVERRQRIPARAELCTRAAVLSLDS